LNYLNTISHTRLGRLEFVDIERLLVMYCRRTPQDLNHLEAVAGSIKTEAEFFSLFIMISELP